MEMADDQIGGSFVGRKRLQFDDAGPDFGGGKSSVVGKSARIRTVFFSLIRWLLLPTENRLLKVVPSPPQSINQR
jgi:hypothetical protein